MYNLLCYDISVAKQDIDKASKLIEGLESLTEIDIMLVSED